MIEIVDPLKGLTWHNVVPACRACSYHKRNGFDTAIKRVREYLAANANRNEDDISLEYLYESEDEEPYVPPLLHWFFRAGGD